MYRDIYDNTRFPTIYRAVVVDNKDPDNRKRLKLQIPQVLNSQSTEWAWPVEPSNLELEVPEIGQGVWAMFEGGDPNFPIWLGVFGDSKSTSLKISINNATSGTLLKTTTGTNGINTVDLIGTLNDLITNTKVQSALVTNIDGGSA
jgi:hypothetical protein